MPSSNPFPAIASNQLWPPFIPHHIRKNSSSAPIGRLDVSHYKIPTDSPESDGTLKWDQTNLVIVVVHAGGKSGLGYTFGGEETAALIHGKLAGVVKGCDAMAPAAAYTSMWNQVRNQGREGICSMAISAID